MANLGKRTRSIRETVKNKENLSVEDAVALVKAGATTIDVVGQIGQDPGSEWTVSPGGATKDFTLVRKNTIESGSTNWSTGSGEWDVYPQDTTYYLGTHGFECD